MVALALYLLLGLSVGAFGTMIGAGGGFILVPILMALHPDFSSVQVTAISMLCVAINATSGGLSYLIKRNVHLKSALLFILAGLPGAWYGTKLTGMVARENFQGVFGVALIAIASFLLWRSLKRPHQDQHGESFSIRNAQYAQGSALSFAVGILASFLGIGGGIIHVPMLIHWLRFPVHLAAGTSHVILAATALGATVAHFFNGDHPSGATFMWPLGLGMALGAQVGAKYSSRIKGSFILKALYAALLLVGLRLLWKSLAA